MAKWSYIQSILTDTLTDTLVLPTILFVVVHTTVWLSKYIASPRTLVLPHGSSVMVTLFVLFVLFVLFATPNRIAVGMLARGLGPSQRHSVTASQRHTWPTPQRLFKLTCAMICWPTLRAQQCKLHTVLGKATWHSTVNPLASDASGGCGSTQHPFPTPCRRPRRPAGMPHPATAFCRVSAA